YLGTFIDFQMEDIRPRIVARDVEVEFAHGNQIHVEVRHDQGFLIEYWFGYIVAKWINDATASTCYHAARRITKFGIQAGWLILKAVILVGAQHEAPTLDSDMPHRGMPTLALIGSRRAINLNALAVHVHSKQRHIVFPADHGSDLAQW